MIVFSLLCFFYFVALFVILTGESVVYQLCGARTNARYAFVYLLSMFSLKMQHVSILFQMNYYKRSASFTRHWKRAQTNMQFHCTPSMEFDAPRFFFSLFFVFSILSLREKDNFNTAQSRKKKSAASIEVRSLFSIAFHWSLHNGNDAHNNLLSAGKLVFDRTELSITIPKHSSSFQQEQSKKKKTLTKK